MQELTDHPVMVKMTPDEDEARIKGISKDLIAAHHEGDLEREIELVIALETIYFRTGRWQDASDCRASLTVLKNERHWRNLRAVA
jgi:hypothetical protein